MSMAKIIKAWTWQAIAIYLFAEFAIFTIFSRVMHVCFGRPSAVVGEPGLLFPAADPLGLVGAGRPVRPARAARPPPALSLPPVRANADGVEASENTQDI